MNDQIFTPMTMKEMVERASKNCQENHKGFVEGCHFCRIDKSIIDALNKPGDR